MTIGNVIRTVLLWSLAFYVTTSVYSLWYRRSTSTVVVVPASVASVTSTAVAATSLKTSLRPSEKKQETKEKRISSLWIVKETDATLEMLLVRSSSSSSDDDDDNDNNKETRRWDLPHAESPDFEIPKKAALRVLLRYGLGEHEVESMHMLRHGSIHNNGEDLHDATSYVTVVTPEHAAVVTQLLHAFKKGSDSGMDTVWLPIAEVFQDHVNNVDNVDKVDRRKSQQHHHRISDLMQDDYLLAREFLEPFVLTAGKNPVKCLGKPPPGWKPEKNRVWPTLRDGGDD